MKRWVALLLAPILVGCGAHSKAPAVPAAPVASTVAALPMSPFQKKVVDGLRDQLTWGTGYDGSYREISYPNGDVPRKKGVCTDVVIRAYRNAGIDLQQLIHNDMAVAWKAYPHIYKLPGP